MASSWPTISIDDIKASSKASISIGPFGSRLKADSYIPFGVPVIRGNNLNGARFLTNEFVYVSDEKANELTSSIVYADDLVFPHRGNIGSVGLVPNDQPRYLLSTSLMKLSVNKTLVDPTFLFYYFTSGTGKHELLKNASQSGTPGIATPLSSLKSIRLQLPPLDEQRHIAHILGSLDDKIELNNQLNSTLEQLTRTLFQSWFVDFAPVRAKASGEPDESICRRLGLTPELLALFPAALEDSKMGEIPAGWEIDKVGNILTVVDFVANGSFASLKENVSLLSEPGYALYVRTTDYNSGFSKEMRFVDESAYRFLSKSSLDGSETIISNVGDVGTVFRAPSWLGYPMTLGSNAVAIRAGSASNYVFQYFKGVAGQNQIQSIITGSAQLKFNKTGLRSLPLLVPEAQVLNAYEKVATDLANQQALLEAESHNLAALRDELLPKLLSGEIRLN